MPFHSPTKVSLRTTVLRVDTMPIGWRAAALPGVLKGQKKMDNPSVLSLFTLTDIWVHWHELQTPRIPQETWPASLSWQGLRVETLRQRWQRSALHWRRRPWHHDFSFLGYFGPTSFRVVLSGKGWREEGRVPPHLWGEFKPRHPSLPANGGRGTIIQRWGVTIQQWRPNGPLYQDIVRVPQTL